MFLCMIRARDVYYRVLERNKRGGIMIMRIQYYDWMLECQASVLDTWPGSVAIDGAGLKQNRWEVQLREEALG